MSLKDLLSMLDDESIYTYYLGSIKNRETYQQSIKE